MVFKDGKLAGGNPSVSYEAACIPAEIDPGAEGRGIPLLIQQYCARFRINSRQLGTGFYHSGVLIRIKWLFSEGSFP